MNETKKWLEVTSTLATDLGRIHEKANQVAEGFLVILGGDPVRISAAELESVCHQRLVIEELPDGDVIFRTEKGRQGG